MGSDFTYATVLSDLDGRECGRLALNRPDRLNAMNPQLIDDVAHAFDDANADDATRAIVFTGAGRAFCAGDDRKDHRQPASEAEARGAGGGHPAGDRGHRPGTEAGGGRHQRLGGRRRVRVGHQLRLPDLGRGARGFFPEVSLGIFVTGGVTSLLPALVGLNRAREMLFLGEEYDAATLLAYGVAWRVVGDDELLPEASAVAARLAALPPPAARAMKRVLTQSAAADLRRALELETDATVSGMLDPETTRRMGEGF